MWKVTIKGLWAKRLRFTMTAIAIVLGVAFVAGTIVLSATIKSTFNGLVTDIYKGTAAVVRGPKLFKSDFGDIRPRIPESVVEQVRDVPGVAAAFGSVNVSKAQIIGHDGKTIGDPGQGAPTFGIAWIPDSRLNSYHLVEGHEPRNSNDVVIDKGAATLGKFRLGDPIDIITLVGTERFHLVGIMRFGNSDNALGSTAAAFTMPTAQRLTKEPGKIDSVVVRSAPDVTSDRVVENLRAALGADPATKNLNVVSGAKITQETQDTIAQIIDVIGVFLEVFAGIALFVGAFLIFNTFSIIVGQRVREMALLRAVGAGQRQIVASVMFEATLVGVLASAVGIGAGVLLARGLKAVMSAFNFDTPASSPVVQANAIIVPFCVGLGVTLVAALLPALRASRVPPIAAMRDVTVEPTGPSRRRLILGSLLLVLGTAILLYGLFGSSDQALILVGLGVALTFLAIAILAPLFARRAAGIIGRPLLALRGSTGNLARENAMRNPRRTASTAAALMIGVGLVVVLMVTVSSFKSSFFDRINNQVLSDYVLSTGGGGGGSGVSGFSLDEAAQVASTEGVRHVLGVRYGFGQIGDTVSQVGALAPGTPGAEKLLDLGVRQGSMRDLGEHGIAVQEDKAEERGLRLGDSVPVRFMDGTRANLTVDAIYKEANPFGAWFVGPELLARHTPDLLDTFLLVNTQGGPSATHHAALQALLHPKYGNSVNIDTRSQFNDRIGASINQFLGFMYAMLAMAIVIALFGIANTLGLSILERRREIGLLRAVGMLRRQVRSAIRWESVIIAMFGAMLGLVIGIVFGWALTLSLKDQGLDRLVVPVGQILVVLVVAGLAGVIAAALPARRAARLDVLDAIRTE